MRVLVVEICLILGCIALFFFKFYPFAIIISIISFFLLVYNLFFDDGSNMIYAILPFSFKRVYNKYGIFYVACIPGSTDMVVLFRDMIFTYYSVGVIYFQDLETMKSMIEKSIEEKYGAASLSTKNIIKSWDGYTNTVDERNGKINKAIK